MAKRRKNNSNGLIIMGLIIVLALVIGGAVAFQFYSFNPKEYSVTCTKDFQQKPSEIVCLDTEGKKVTPDSLFAQEKLIEYFGGSSLTVTFEAKNGPNVIAPESVELDKEKSAQFDEPGRRKKVEAKRAQFTAALAKLNDPEARDTIVEVCADITSKFQKTDRERLSSQSTKQFEQILTTGNAVTKIYGITAVDNLREKGEVTLAKGSDLKLLSSFLNDNLPDSNGENGSAISTGLFNALKQNQGKDRVVIIYSDLMEKDSRTMDFYKTKLDFKDQKNWEQIKQALTKVEPVPDLKGTKVFIIAPPNVNSAKFREVLLFWTWLLKEGGGSATSVDYIV